MNKEYEIEELAPWLVLLVTLIGAGLRILFLANKGLWMDEAFSVWLSDHSVAERL